MDAFVQWVVLCFVLAMGEHEERGDATPLPDTLGTQDLELVAPRGGGSTFERFEWRYLGERRDVSFDLRIEDAEGRLLVRQRGLFDSWWILPPEDRARMPARIHWEVVVRDPSSRELSLDRAEAWR